MILPKSIITKKILNYFFINPNESLYVNELSRKLVLDKRNLVKKIKELEREGILTHETRGNLKLYSINRQFPLYDEFRKIVMSITGLEEQLRRLLQGVSHIKEAFVFGSYAKDTMDAHSDIDVFVVGDVSAITLQKSILGLQRDLGREFNVTIMGEIEYQKRVKEKEPFISGILKQKRIKII